MLELFCHHCFAANMQMYRTFGLHLVIRSTDFDQFHFFKGCTPEQTRAEVRRCFEAAGTNGGYILCPSDHFFDADIELIHAYADEAKKCLYEH